MKKRGRERKREKGEGGKKRLKKRRGKTKSRKGKENKRTGCKKSQDAGMKRDRK